MKLPIIPETMSSDDELTPNAEKLGKVGLLGHFPVPAEETLFSHNEPRGEKSLLENSKQTARLSLQEQALNAFCIGLNICSTVGVVFLNKMIFRDPQLRNMQITFAMWHFACTSLVLWIASQKPFHLFEPIRLPFLKMIPLCSFFAGFLILGNLSLAFNSVEFYQLTKVMTTPCLVLLNFLLFRKTIEPVVGVALVTVCLGVTLTNTGSPESTLVGTFIAVLSFVVAALYQIWIGKKMKDFAVSSPQLLMNQAPISVLLLATMAPFFDTFTDPRTIPTSTLVALFASGIVASILNLSQFLVIERMSALTFNVAGNVKTVIIVVLSWISQGRILTVKDGLGVMLAVGGAMWYSQLSQK